MRSSDIFITILIFIQKVRTCFARYSPSPSSPINTQRRTILRIYLDSLASFYWYSHSLSSHSGLSHCRCCFSSSRMTSDDSLSLTMLTSRIRSDAKHAL